MNEMRYGGNLFLLPDGTEAAVVTTNGIVKNNAEAVMGAGIARYARDNFQDSAKILGRLLTKHGNHAYFLGSFHDRNRVLAGKPGPVFVATMPTKNHWRDPSDIDLIRQSARELMTIADKNNLTKVYLPAPGCSNGRLDYASQVRPVIAGILDSRFTVCLAPALYDSLTRQGAKS